MPGAGPASCADLSRPNGIVSALRNHRVRGARPDSRPEGAYRGKRAGTPLARADERLTEERSREQA